MKTLRILSIFLFILFGIGGDTFAQSKKEIRTKAKIAEVSKLLSSKRFAFKAQSAQPLRGGNFNITSDYDLAVKSDTLLSYLPYFGRAFSAPINPTNSPLNFTSTQFTYTSNKGKKGSTDIKIEIKDSKIDVRQYLLSVSEQGYATLQTLSNNRDPITFNGYITGLQ
ncbi:MAG: DUF4251 domain-containing protein [Chitinophagaceae bacterium]|nr:MAG: DUF4251 domain-containing protein [Chitinophagaceae bacterium]